MALVRSWDPQEEPENLPEGHSDAPDPHDDDDRERDERAILLEEARNADLIERYYLAGITPPEF